MRRIHICEECKRAYESEHLGQESSYCPRCNPEDSKGNVPIDGVYAKLQEAYLEIERLKRRLSEKEKALLLELQRK